MQDILSMQEYILEKKTNTRKKKKVPVNKFPILFILTFQKNT